MLWFDWCEVLRESYPRRIRGAIAELTCSAANLRERAQATDTHLEERMLARLDRESRPEKGFERNSFAQRSAQIDFFITEQASA
jgi:hypothetical protein